MKNQTSQDGSGLDEAEQPLLYHLIELRDRLLRVVLVVAVVFVVLIPFSSTLFTLCRVRCWRICLKVAV